MPRQPFSRPHLDPRRSLNFLDSCAFDPKYSPEHEAATQLRAFGGSGAIVLNIAHSNQKEIEHPNTPPEVKREALGMIYSIETTLTQEEINCKATIHAILTGAGNPEKYAADAAHVFEAGKYHGYFVTTDARILARKAELERVTAVVIVKPSQWLAIYAETASA